MTAVAAQVNLEKTLPFSEESERAVLAAILLDSQRHLPPTAGRLDADDFYQGPELLRIGRCRSDLFRGRGCMQDLVPHSKRLVAAE